MIKKIWKQMKRVVRFTKGLYWGKKGYNRGWYSYVHRNMEEAYDSAPLPARQKKWAVKRGFYPYHVWQYGLTEENYRSIVSDWDYGYLYPLNNYYQELIDNKLFAWYTLAPFRAYLPKHYYHLLRDRGILRLMDCPEACGASLDGIVRLVRSLGIAALKKTGGAHGDGFYKIRSVGDGFEANDKALTEEEFRTFLSGLDEYIITDYIKMHPVMETLNPCSVNTIRVCAVNEHGNDPVIPSAYLRIGTKNSGATDNVGSGGMFCKIDVETGRFYDGEVLNNHVTTKVTHHPDTNAPLEGIIPNWELAKSVILQICNYIPDLEWLGFDIAITPESICVVEINVMQDMHKAHEYPEAVSGYLFRKLKEKKEKYGVKERRV